MTRLLIELKTRARLRLNAARRERPDADLRLRHCLNQAARDVGFANWDHGCRVLGGQAVHADDMGSFWHAPRCNTLLNLWFADYARARCALASEPGTFLLPYRRQFIVAEDDFILELGLDPDDAAWTRAGRDLVSAYGTDAWLTLGFQRLTAPPSMFAVS
jgi:hypothetical protein